jgi:AcrR family transcriptional regulator
MSRGRDAVAPAEARARRRQARGERRIALLLDVAAQVFAECGYEASTTNAIAARAGMSPGSLYQFFPNKEAIAEALAARYLERFQLAHDLALAPDVAVLPLDELLDRVIDPLVAANVAEPGFEALLSGSDASQRLAAATHQLNQAMIGRTESMLAVRAPHLTPEHRTRAARVCFQIFKSFLPLLRADDAERDVLTTELKHVLGGYLGPLDGEAAPSDVPSL